MQGGGSARLREALLEALGIFAPGGGQHVLVGLPRRHCIRPQRQQHLCQGRLLSHYRNQVIVTVMAPPPLIVTLDS